MEPIFALFLGVLQGITEFLPISSSAHLAIVERFLKMPYGVEAMASFDIFLHAGSLLAILIYFWSDLKNIFQKLSLPLIVGTLPAIAVGLVFGKAADAAFRGILPIALSLMIGGAYFWIAEGRFTSEMFEGAKTFSRLQNLKTAFLIGIAQAFAAVFHGLSRSGATISTGLLCGLRRDEATRFSFLLGGIAILAANVYTVAKIFKSATPQLMPDFSFIALGTLASFLFSLAAIRWLIRYLKTNTLRPFGVYIFILGLILLAFFR